jgi:hypothetical protein
MAVAAVQPVGGGTAAAGDAVSAIAAIATAIEAMRRSPGCGHLMRLMRHSSGDRTVAAPPASNIAESDVIEPARDAADVTFTLYDAAHLLSTESMSPTTNATRGGYPGRGPARVGCRPDAAASGT